MKKDDLALIELQTIRGEPENFTSMSISSTISALELLSADISCIVFYY